MNEKIKINEAYTRCLIDFVCSIAVMIVSLMMTLISIFLIATISSWYTILFVIAALALIISFGRISTDVDALIELAKRKDDFTTITAAYMIQKEKTNEQQQDRTHR